MPTIELNITTNLNNQLSKLNKVQKLLTQLNEAIEELNKEGITFEVVTKKEVKDEAL